VAEARDGVRNDPEHERFVFPADGTFGAVYYRVDPGIITYIHTEVPPGIG
jgi:predicted GNAT family acetyltransferase